MSKVTIIAIEGHDYAGKTSVALEFAKSLNEKGISALYKKIPDYTIKTGKIIASYLRGDFKPGSQLAMSAVYTLNRVRAVREAVEQAEKENIKVLVLDRCYLSNSATMFTKDLIDPNLGFRQSLKMFNEEVMTLEFEDGGVPKPDHIVTLFCDDSIIERRMSLRDADSVVAGGKPDIHENMERIRLAKACYLYLTYLSAEIATDTSGTRPEDIGYGLSKLVTLEDDKVKLRKERDALIPVDYLNQATREFDNAI